MSEWIEWDGGDCPVDVEALINVRLRDFADEYDTAIVPAGSFVWAHGNKFGAKQAPGDIIAYRVSHSQAPSHHTDTNTGAKG